MSAQISMLCEVKDHYRYAQSVPNSKCLDQQSSMRLLANLRL